MLCTRLLPQAARAMYACAGARCEQRCLPRKHACADALAACAALRVLHAQRSTTVLSLFIFAAQRCAGAR